MLCRQVKWASAHTIYVEWNPVRQDAMGLPLAAGEVEYVLNLKGGFVNLYEGLEVLVEILVGNEKYERPRLYKDGEPPHQKRSHACCAALPWVLS